MGVFGVDNWTHNTSNPKDLSSQHASGSSDKDSRNNSERQGLRKGTFRPDNFSSLKTENADPQRRDGQPHLPAKKEHGLEERMAERQGADAICDMAHGHTYSDLFAGDLRSPLHKGDVHKLTVTQRQVQVVLNTTKGKSANAKKQSIGRGDKREAEPWLESLLAAIGR